MKSKVIMGIVLMLLLTGTLTVAFNIQQAGAAGPPATEWTRTYGGAEHDYAYSVVQTADGGYALAGYTLSFPVLSVDAYLVKVNSSGGMEWNRTYGGASYDYAYSVVETGDGGYALAGETTSFGAGGTDFWLVKTDASGTMEWNKTYGGTLDDQGNSVVETGDGGYALAGWTNSFGAGKSDSWLVKVAGPPLPVGGIWVPVDKLALLAPYLALVATIILAVSISAGYIKYRKKHACINVPRQLISGVRHINITFIVYYDTI